MLDAHRLHNLASQVDPPRALIGERRQIGEASRPIVQGGTRGVIVLTGLDRGGDDFLAHADRQRLRRIAEQVRPGRLELGQGDEAGATTLALFGELQAGLAIGAGTGRRMGTRQICAFRRRWRRRAGAAILAFTFSVCASACARIRAR
jgi:hypothetical protein